MMHSQKQQSLTYISFEPLQEGHASYTHVIEILQGLEKEHWSTHLFSPRYKENKRKSPFGRLGKFLHILFLSLFSKKSDVYYTRLHFMGAIIAIIAYIKKRPMIVEVNGPFEDLYTAWPGTKKFSFIFNALYLFQLRQALGIISVTKELEHYCKQKLKSHDTVKNFTVIPNGAAVDIFAPLRDLTTTADLTFLPKGKQYAIFFGTFAKWQGINLLLEAAIHLDWPKELHLILLGDGAVRPIVEQHANKYDHIHYIGKKPYSEVAPYIANAEMGFVLTQNIDNRGQHGAYPLKLFETLACGIPVIATPISGQADIIKTGNCGIILDKSSLKDLLNAVNILYEQKEQRKRLGENGSIHVRKNYSWRHLSTLTSNFIKETLS